MLAKMPNTDSTTRPRRSPRFLRTEDTLHQNPTSFSLRRSPRLSHLAQGRPPSSYPSLSSVKKPRKCWSEETVSEKPRKPREGFGNRGNSSTGSKKPRGLGENLRRSLRISLQCRESLVKECNPIEEEKLGIARAEKPAEAKPGNSREAVAERRCEESRKRKMEECEGLEGTVREWTEEQEMALRRAYLVVKPTPSFWTKVSRLVPGKSAQDCFNKLNSDYATPPQRGQLSRVRRKNVSPIPHFQLSASKVLKPNEPKAKNYSCNKQKRYAAHKNARQLLKEHYRHNQVHEADLFSVLEANSDLSTEPYKLSSTFSTPKNLHKTQELHRMFDKRSTSGGKKPLSRFSASRGKALVSPLVLKQVNNRVMHERYIDQLHCRDAKRKIASTRSGKLSLKIADRKENQILTLDVVRAAKNSLVSDARDAIAVLQQIRAYPANNSSDSDDDVFKSDADESEIDM